MGPAQMQHTMPCGDVNWGKPVITWSSLRTTGEQAKTLIRKLQLGNQISLNHANPILTESYGDWRTRRSPAFGAARGKKFMGPEHSSEPVPAGYQGSGLMRWLTKTGLGTRAMSSIKKGCQRKKLRLDWRPRKILSPDPARCLSVCPSIRSRGWALASHSRGFHLPVVTTPLES
jgi:hypothetical protein